MGRRLSVRKRMSTQKAKIQPKNVTQINITEKKSKMDSPASNQQKKIWSFDSLVAAMEPSPEELKYRKEKLGESGFLKKYSKFFKCTKCQLNIKPHIVKHKQVPVHPSLGVLMCENCCSYYQDGEFSLDSDGEDKYCRWCGEGGTIFSCSKCICGFCVACIKQHFKTDYLKQVQQDEKWLCFFCNPKPLWDQRFICSLALTLSENTGLTVASSSFSTDEEDVTSFESPSSKHSTPQLRRNKIGTFKRPKTKKKSTGESLTELKNGTSNLSSGNREESKNIPVLTSSSDESDVENPKKRLRHTSTPLKKLQENSENDSFESIKDSVLSQLKNILSLSDHKMNFGVTWTTKMLKKLSGPGYITTHEGLMKECQEMKLVLSTMSASLKDFSKSVDSVEKTLCSNDGEKVQNDFPSKDQSAYINILEFLGFIRGQVKTFMEKGFSLSDIFEAEVYDDDKVIGLKKKSDFLKVASNENRDEIPVSGNNYDINKDFGTKSKEDTLQNKAHKFGGGDDSMCNVVVGQAKEDCVLIQDQDGHKDIGVPDQTTYSCLHVEDDSSNTTFVESSDLKNADPKDDIREILAILENA